MAKGQQFCVGTCILTDADEIVVRSSNKAFVSFMQTDLGSGNLTGEFLITLKNAGSEMVFIQYISEALSSN